jgi:D-serine deaminase-like pyridoxal phosphate-dependent protein
MSIADLTTPALLLDLDVLEKNLSRMQERANRLGVALRPHGKTHKCPEIAKRQIELGAIGLTVATLKEARAFASAGITDLTWAFPLPPCHAGAAVALARAITLRLVVDSGEAVDALLAAGAGKDSPPVHVWLKVDCGYHRAGVDPGSGYAATLAQRLATEPPLVFDGILTHSGHAYDVASSEEAARVAEEERSVMTSFAGKLREGGIPVPGISVGSTPAMSAVKNLDGVTEIRPGNYAFYDGAQWAMGSCGLDDCAVTVLASVISHQPGASWFVTDAGASRIFGESGS